jgi:hypothetical protein
MLQLEIELSDEQEKSFSPANVYYLIYLLN